MLLAVTIRGPNRNPLWLDEAFSLGAADEFVRTVRSTGATMAIYYLLLVPWVKTSSAAGVRLPSMLFALATLPVVALLGRRVGGRRLAVVAPPLLALVYLFGLKAAEACAPVPLETLLVTIGWYAVVRVLDLGVEATARLRWWCLLALLAFIGPFAHGLFRCSCSPGSWRSRLSPTPGRALVAPSRSWWPPASC